MTRALLALALAAASFAGSSPRVRQPRTTRDRIWLAGRYDSTHVIVYLDTVTLHDSLPTDTVRIRAPRVFGFFDPIGVSASDISAMLARNARAYERFTTGDRYDLLVGGGRMAVVTLTQPVAFLSDEGVGNNSYIGALAELSSKDLALLTPRDFYVVVPHEPSHHAVPAGIVDTNASPTERAAVTRLLQPLRGKLAPGGRLSLVQTDRVRLASGESRWFVTAAYRAGERACTTITAWITPAPTLRLVSADTITCLLDMPKDPPLLLNVVAIGPNRTALVVRMPNGDGTTTSVLEYRDGQTIRQMHELWTVAAGE